ncbi:SMP-30/gluconolactonase/LRE family protein [Phenylobacterium sp.]|uniref:SMP-30/gluconolactonase/LRE family protein n=1 Tax=Phenylobacterium sp. TaxID=1871053 RepID=UPI002DEAAC87|nr:SMP-30/gluconolactonase/LRE family protein [Phenylobacterium sp.]
MNRRDFMGEVIAALPLAALAGPALAQPAPLPPLVDKPALPWTIVAEGLKFPEGPVAMKDGSLLFVEIERRTISRLTPAGKVEIVAQLDGGPNGLAVGPDGALYIANNGGRFTYVMRGGLNSPGAPPPGFTAGGKIQRLDLKSGQLTTLYDSVEGRPIVAADDLVFDRHGGLWISDIAVKPGTGSILYAPRLGEPLRVAHAGLNPNGIGVSPDGRFLHVSSGTSLYGFDIDGPGQLAAHSYPSGGLQAPLWQGSIADSLKIQADGKVCVCSLLRPGGIGVVNRAGHTDFLGFPDRWVCNLAFGGRDMRDCWIMLSGLGQIAKVRWPAPGQTPAFRA